MSSRALNCAPDATGRWRNYTNLKNLCHIHKSIRNGNFVLARLRNVNPQITFAPILKLQGFEKGYEDCVFVSRRIWKELGGKDIRVKLEHPRTRLARIHALYLRLKYDWKFALGRISGLSVLLITSISMAVQLSFPINYILAAIVFVLGAIPLLFIG